MVDTYDFKIFSGILLWRVFMTLEFLLLHSRGDMAELSLINILHRVNRPLRQALLQEKGQRLLNHDLKCCRCSKKRAGQIDGFDFLSVCCRT